MSDVPVGQAGLLEVAPALGLSAFKASWRRFSRNRLAVGSMVILILIVLLCFAGPLVFPFGPEDADFEKFPTAATAVIEFDAPGWADVGWGEGRLADFVVPRRLE